MSDELRDGLISWHESWIGDGIGSRNFIRCGRMITKENPQGWVNETVHNEGMMLIHVGRGTCMTSDAYIDYELMVRTRENADRRARMNVRRTAREEFWRGLLDGKGESG